MMKIMKKMRISQKFFKLLQQQISNVFHKTFIFTKYTQRVVPQKCVVSSDSLVKQAPVQTVLFLCARNALCSLRINWPTLIVRRIVMAQFYMQRLIQCVRSAEIRRLSVASEFRISMSHPSIRTEDIVMRIHLFSVFNFERI